MKIDGKRIFDADRPQTIVITKDDVKKGSAKNPLKCAAALACCRDLRASEARIHLTKSYVKIRNRWYRFATPVALRSEIVAFDRGGSFEPGEYELKPISPNEIQTRGARRGGNAADKPKKIGKRRHITTGVRYAAFK